MSSHLMRRRTFVAGLGAAAAWPFEAIAQNPARMPLIAWLGTSTRTSSVGFVDAFQQGMRELGYLEGRNFEIEYRFADNYNERLPSLASELVQLKPAAILAAASGPAVAARNATSTIPIVVPALADAVHLGLVVSEARPGGNVTGISPYIAGLPAKQMELAREVMPGASRIGVLTNMNDPKAPPQWHELEDAGLAKGVKVFAADVGTPDDLNGAFRALADARVDELIVLQTSMLVSERAQIAKLAAANRLPAIYGYREHVSDGGLISYGVNLRAWFRRAATYVVKILKGAVPGDLPVEFPTEVELVVNLKTAKALGLTISPTLLGRADEVIE